MLNRDEQFDWTSCAEVLKDDTDPISEDFFNRVMASGLVESLDLYEGDEEAYADWNDWYGSIKRG